MDVVKDGETAGTEGQGLRLEALRIYIVKPDVDSKDSAKLQTVDNNGNQINYTYDANGNIETITQGGKAIKYSYNELNEVTREDNAVLNKTVVYKYDLGGNIVSKTEYPYSTGNLAAATNTINYGYGDSNWKDKLTNYNGKNITYDAIGNPLNDGTYSYTWEQGRQLAAISGNGQNISYKYNDSGIRTEKTVNGVTTKYHLNGDKVTYETDGTNQIYYTYDSAGKLLSMNLNGIEYYYIKNAQDDIIGLIDKAGTQVTSYTYDTYGKVISIDGSLKDTVGKINPYRYREYRYDSETGLYYLQSRYYNPEWGRFVNADTEGGSIGELLSHNVFAYCGNNPVNTLDSNGQSWEFIGEFFQQVANAFRAFAPAYAGAAGCEFEPGPGTLAGLAIAGVASLAVIGVAAYKTATKSKAKTISKTNTQKPKPKYWEADYNERTKHVDIGVAITPDQAEKRVANNKSIMCANYNSAKNIALKFPYPDLEINKGSYGKEGYYPHFHIKGGHGDPHIWFFPAP
ncbi:RHS repeat-associated core domain-containing protein [Clostridium felsineum]|uniref:RHS repeat-associated core domain-containing protein n=1 Tax=Clostridium felsineum TaxID=36839 RepID=UPI00098C718D|nr:RHS repeat-associated core domain-containing protein [Clostridium felsineum]URZ04113.1 hypothetical protein CLAUR_042010 [Clostridium felsineum]